MVPLKSFMIWSKTEPKMFVSKLLQRALIKLSYELKEFIID